MKKNTELLLSVYFLGNVASYMYFIDYLGTIKGLFIGISILAFSVAMIILHLRKKEEKQDYFS